MTRSGEPFHGAHGEGRSAISPAASQAGAEPCARTFPAARARRNAPVINDNAVVAAAMNWRAESTGNPLPLSTWSELDGTHSRRSCGFCAFRHAVIVMRQPVALFHARFRVLRFRCAVVIGVFLAVDRRHMRRIFIEIRSPDSIFLAVRIDPFPQALA